MYTGTLCPRCCTSRDAARQETETRLLRSRLQASCNPAAAALPRKPTLWTRAAPRSACDPHRGTPGNKSLHPGQPCRYSMSRGSPASRAASQSRGRSVRTVKQRGERGRASEGIGELQEAIGAQLLGLIEWVYLQRCSEGERFGSTARRRGQ